MFKFHDQGKFIQLAQRERAKVSTLCAECYVLSSYGYTVVHNLFSSSVNRDSFKFGKHEALLYIIPLMYNII